MEKLYQRLQMTQSEYELNIWTLWTQWCATKTDNDNSLQRAIGCQPLFNWWQSELRKLEADFLDQTDAFEDSICKQTAFMLYKECTNPINERFSKPLLKQAYD